MMAHNHSLSSSSEALPASDSDMSADESGTSGSLGRGQESRLTSLQQANRVLKMEVEMYKLRCKQLQEENKALRQASVSIVSALVLTLLCCIGCCQQLYFPLGCPKISSINVYL